MSTVTRIRPLVVDDFPRPSLAEVEIAERDALRRGDSRRAMVYRIVRMRRLRRAQREAV